MTCKRLPAEKRFLRAGINNIEELSSAEGQVTLASFHFYLIEQNQVKSKALWIALCYLVQAFFFLYSLPPSRKRS
jgi:hypothetical protein